MNIASKGESSHLKIQQTICPYIFSKQIDQNEFRIEQM